MKTELSYLQFNWWAFAIRGLIASTLAVLVFYMPDITIILYMALLFGIYAIFEWIYYLVLGIQLSNNRIFIFSGIASIICGHLVFIIPLLTTIIINTILCSIIALTFITKGIFELNYSFKLKTENKYARWLLITHSILSIILGAMILMGVMVYPEAGVILLGYLIGYSFLLIAITLFALAFQFKKYQIKMLFK